MPPPKTVPTQGGGGGYGFVGEAVGGVAAESGPREGTPQMDAGARPLVAVVVCLDG